MLLLDCLYIPEKNFSVVGPFRSAALKVLLKLATATAQFQLCVQQIPQKLHLQQQISQLQVELQLAFPLQLILAASGGDSISQVELMSQVKSACKDKVR
ncbi:hypothetical protein DAPPUDRAFT_259126 [Daphnia pulex]|uniref:Uncharacterized protein n=1 Tax=Daphnia pulex TaxID=6669 RepID=E9HGL2_DAPPU|nr:hypothetical protein DAPPUDRAFT_259126 [Daphnia pulex]|eukprot:EFX69132.1 hypothetical protein DAPPUDRAFT_259126 [Daphnia pulex]